MKISIMMVAEFLMREKRGTTVENRNENNMSWSLYSYIMFYTK